MADNNEVKITYGDLDKTYDIKVEIVKEKLTNTKREFEESLLELGIESNDLGELDHSSYEDILKKLKENSGPGKTVLFTHTLHLAHRLDKLQAEYKELEAFK